MNKLEIDPFPYYLIAIVASLSLAMGVTGFASARFPIPDDNGTMLGLLVFWFFIFFDLFAMYHVWTMRYEREGHVVARWLTGFAAGGLLVASMAGISLWLLGRISDRYPFEAWTIIWGFLLVSSLTNIMLRWLERRKPATDVSQPPESRNQIVGRRMSVTGDWIMTICGIYLLASSWPSSRMAVVLIIAGTLVLVAATVLWMRRQQRVH